MNNYFYVGPEGQQCGPIDMEGLKSCGITRETLVWCGGMANWMKAGEVPELAPLFANVPPPIPAAPVPPPVAPNVGTTVVIHQQEQQMQQEQSNGCGVAGLVFSIIALFTSAIPGLGWITWFLGALLSFIGVFKEPRGTAIAGLIISFIGIFIMLVVVGGAMASLGAVAALH